MFVGVMKGDTRSLDYSITSIIPYITLYTNIYTYIAVPISFSIFFLICFSTIQGDTRGLDYFSCSSGEGTSASDTSRCTVWLAGLHVEELHRCAFP